MKKTSSPLRPVFWSLGVSVFLMVLLFGAGLFYQSIIGKIEAGIATSPTVADFNKRLSTRVGRTYEARDHDRLVSIMEADARVQASLLKASKSFSTVVFQIAGGCTLLSLLACFHLIRKSHQISRSPESPTNHPPQAT